MSFSPFGASHIFTVLSVINKLVDGGENVGYGAGTCHILLPLPLRGMKLWDSLGG